MGVAPSPPGGKISLAGVGERFQERHGNVFSKIISYDSKRLRDRDTALLIAETFHFRVFLHRVVIDT